MIWNIPDPDGAGPCAQSSDAMTVTVNTSTIANAGADKTVCGINPVTLSANAVTGANWTGGAGTFNPNRNSANAIYTPALSEIGITVTLTWNTPARHSIQMNY